MTSKAKTFYSRREAADALGISRRQLIRWEREAAEEGGPLAGVSLMIPAILASAWDRTVRYHRSQLALLLDALAAPERMADCCERWDIIRQDLGEHTLAMADDIGLTRALHPRVGRPKKCREITQSRQSA